MNPILEQFISDAKIQFDKVVCTNPNSVFLTKWEWDYQDCLAFQLKTCAFINSNPELKVIIITNHSPLFTMGRGLQKGKDPIYKTLIETDESELEDLPLPVHHIKRGGGLTFHHPGQIIIYPIIKLHKLSLKNLIDLLLVSTIEVFENEFSLKDFSKDHTFLGLWWKQFKLGSIGIAAERFVTYHGMAINILNNPQISEVLKKLNPCGINSSTYKSLVDILLLNGIEKEIDIKKLSDQIIEKLGKHL